MIEKEAIVIKYHAFQQLIKKEDLSIHYASEEVQSQVTEDARLLLSTYYGNPVVYDTKSVRLSQENALSGCVSFRVDVKVNTVDNRICSVVYNGAGLFTVKFL